MTKPIHTPSTSPTKEFQPRQSRRRMLELTGVLAATAAVSGALSQVQAEDELPPTEKRITTDSELRPLYSQARTLGVEAVAALPPAPDLGVVALNRMAFGNRPDDPANSVGAFNARPGATPADKLKNYVDEQLAAPADDSGDVGDVTGRITPAAFPSLYKPLTQLWSDYYKEGDKSIPLREARIATFTRAMYSKWQLREVVVDFWHNHFNVYAWDYAYAMPTWPDYDRIIRANCFGNFRTFLEAIGKSTAMLFYLDQYLSQAPLFNENYARELFELHGMGAENYLGVVPDALTVPDCNPADYPGMTLPTPLPPKGYVDADVYAAARCFTGWTVNDDYQTGNGAFEFESTIHDRAEKRVLKNRILDNMGNSDPSNGLFVYDQIVNHPGTAKFIARKLCRRLIADTPPDTIVNAAAAVFYSTRAQPDQIKQTIQIILLSNEFRTTWAQKIKRPFEAAVAFLRATRAEFAPTLAKEDFFWYYDAIGQSLFARRAPDGYADRSTAWRSTTSLLMRWKLSNWIVEAGLPKDRPDIKVDLVAQTPGSIVRSARALARYWCERIFGMSGVDATTSAYYATFNQSMLFMAQGSNADTVLSDSVVTERLPRMVELILQSPDFQWR